MYNAAADLDAVAHAQVIHRVKQLLDNVELADPHTLKAQLSAAIDATNRRFSEEINLYAGTNAVSDLAKEVAAVELSARPSLGTPGRKFPPGIEDLDLLEVTATEAVRRTMRAQFAEVRPYSATLANLAVLVALTKPGDTIAALPERAGGHVSQREGAPSVRGLTVVDLPYDYEKFDVDHDRLGDMLAETRPKVVVVGGNLMIRPHDLGRLVEAAATVGARVVYDASHVAGLIAGGAFQSPLADGVDVMTFSTYKSYGGPSGGVICTDDAELAAASSAAVFPTLSANYDIHRLAPLAITASEHLAAGSTYADRCIANARALARGLVAGGITVLGEGFGYTESHHVAVDVRAHGGGDAAARLLASAGIYSSPTVLPRAASNPAADGLRLGTQELTRRGLDEPLFHELGSVTAALLRGSLGASDGRQRARDLWRGAREER